MPARRTRFRPARLFAIFMAMQSLAVAILWADSYRPRERLTLPVEREGYQPSMLSILDAIRHFFEKSGGEFLIYSDDENLFRVVTFKGRLNVLYASPVSADICNRSIEMSWRNFTYKRRDSSPNMCGAEYCKSNPLPTDRWREVTCPFWALFIFCAACPTIQFIRGPLRRRKRRRRGQCIDCGYDLRGSAGRCPECGAATPDGHGAARGDGPTV